MEYFRCVLRYILRRPRYSIGWLVSGAGRGGAVPQSYLLK